MSDKVIFREAERGDIPFLLPLLEQLFAVEEDFVFDALLQAKGLELLIASSSAIVMVAEVEGILVGMATGQVVISTAEGAPALVVEDVSVSSSFRNRGIGTSLLDALGDKGAEIGACRMQLLADKNNADGLAFYEKLGWKTTALICLRKYTGG